MNRRKVCVITGSRAEYGLLLPLLKKLSKHASFQLQLVATGMHLSPEFGQTYKTIEVDGFAIDRKLEILLSSDSAVGTAKSTGLAVAGFADVFADLRPDLVVVLGDRFEILGATTAAMLMRIPVAHISGGEVTTGAFDDGIRHAITKMSHLHFPSHDIYRRRILQLGEASSRVFNVGALGVDAILHEPRLSRQELEADLGISLEGHTALVTFHPVTLEPGRSVSQFEEVLAALDRRPDLKLVFTRPNADPEGRQLNERIDAYVGRWPGRAHAFTSLGGRRYLSLLATVSVVIGNSSSGIAEAPSFRVPTVNIGNRQQGRIMAESVISCAPERTAVDRALTKAFSTDFQRRLTAVTSPFGDGQAAARIVATLEQCDFSKLGLKPFIDLTFEEPTT